VVSPTDKAPNPQASSYVQPHTLGIHLPTPEDRTHRRRQGPSRNPMTLNRSGKRQTLRTSPGATAMI